MTDDDTDWLTAKEAAARLGVKVETLYAYVSRGLVDRVREPGQRASRFAAADIDALAGRSRPVAPVEAGTVLRTRLTSIHAGRLRYRGLDAGVLAGERCFERVAEWLWTGDRAVLEAPDAPAWVPDPGHLAVCRGAQASLPDETPLPDRIRLIVASLAPLDAFRFDLSPAAVAAAARTLITTVVEALPETRPGTDSPPPAVLENGERLDLATRLWGRLSPEPPSPGLRETLNAALVLLADHELATSTFAARVAASVRADPYSVVTAGLGAVSGGLHGGMGPRAVALLRSIGRPAEVVPAISEHLKHESRLPGFGHPLYPGGDPRAGAVLARLRASTLTRGQAARLETVNRVIEIAGTRMPVRANIDFALGALCYVGPMPPGAAEAVFSIARTAGWIAHALEEYGEPPLRFRVRAEYVGALEG